MVRNLLSTSDEPCCGNCRYFIRHYIHTDRRYRPLAYGHCIHPNLKPRSEDVLACRYYQPHPEVAKSPE